MGVSYIAAATTAAAVIVVDATAWRGGGAVIIICDQSYIVINGIPAMQSLLGKVDDCFLFHLSFTVSI